MTQPVSAAALKWTGVFLQKCAVVSCCLLYQRLMYQKVNVIWGLISALWGIRNSFTQKENKTPKLKGKKICFIFHYFLQFLLLPPNGWDTHTREGKNNLVNSQPALLKQNEISFTLNKTSRLIFLLLVPHRMISLVQTTLSMGRNALYETLPGYKRAVKAKLFEL